MQGWVHRQVSGLLARAALLFFTQIELFVCCHGIRTLDFPMDTIDFGIKIRAYCFIVENLLLI